MRIILIALLTAILAACGGSGGGGGATTYGISGIVSGATQADVTLNLTGAATMSVSSEASGNFSFASRANGTYTVTPSKAGYTFSPVSTAVIVSGANVSGINFVTSALADPAAADLYITNGAVYSTARSPDGNTLYIGGYFTQVGPRTGGAVPIDITSALPVSNFPKVAGEVYASVPDGSDGWYIGGQFTKVGTATRNNLAHILANGSVDTNWDPNANGQVNALAVSGSTVYAGGGFTTFGSGPGLVTRRFIAALSTTDGTATVWNPNMNSFVYSLAISGATVYAGGLFTTVGSGGTLVTRNRIAALDITSGLALAWDPNANNIVYTLAVSGNTVYVGGDFTTLGNGTTLVTRNRIAALDVTDGLASAWNPNANGVVFTLAVAGNTVYAGGGFNLIGATAMPRNQIAALDTVSGEATSWNPDASTTNSFGTFVRTLAVSGATVYVGGLFGSIGGQTRNNIAAIDAATGLPGTWNPNANNRVYTLAVSSSVVYAGGQFTSIGGQTRKRIAALDATTGAVTAWNPNAESNSINTASVQSLAVSGSTVYAGGYFASIGGQSRNNIAALNAVDGLATAWNPNANNNANNSNSVTTLVVSGDTICVGGHFDSIGVTPVTRNNIVALNTANGEATTWNPNANGDVNTLAVSGSIIYAGGQFTSIGATPVTRNRIAALNAADGEATTWNPNANSEVNTLAVSGSIVYAGGQFTSIGATPVTRNRIAALNIADGEATTWNPIANSTVYTLAVSGITVYAGGLFTTINSQASGYITAIAQ